MKRLYGAVAVSAGLLALAACSDATGVNSSSSGVDLAPSYSKDVTPEEAQESHVHYMPLASNAEEAAARREARQAGKSGGSGIFYHGGPVLQSGTKVVAVYWASAPIYTGGPAAGTFNTTSGSGDGSLIGFFLNHEGGTPYFGINSSYTDGSGRAIANSVTYSGYWANNTSAPSGTTKITDTQMIAMLQSGFNSGALKYDASTLYVIFTSGKVNLGGGFGTQYCGYHTHGTVTVSGVAKTALYAALPYDYAYPSACSNGTASPNADPGADAELSVLAHEVEETTTDMLGNAWYDTRGYENADKCAWTWGTTYNNGTGIANVNIAGKDFLIQQNWKNVSGGGCAMHL
jgi:hypothetical protein